MNQQIHRVFTEAPLSLAEIDGFGLEEETTLVDLDGDDRDDDDHPSREDRVLSLDKMFI